MIVIMTNRNLQKIKTAIAILFACMLIILVGVPAFAQEPISANWETDIPPEGGWTIGDLITIRLQATYSADFKVAIPELSDQWGPFEVQSQNLTEPSQNSDGSLTVIREATVILWAPGEHETPEFEINYEDGDENINVLRVTPISISIESVLAEGELEKQDLKPQASLPKPAIWHWVLIGILAAIVVIIIAWFLLHQWRKRRSSETEVLEVIDTRLPEEIAYEELDRITLLDLPARGEYKHHYELVTNCVRSYLERIYKIPAMESTTGEIMSSLRSLRLSQMSKDIIPSLRSLLDESDLVKFAKLDPSIERARDTVAQARSIVDITKPDREKLDDRLEGVDTE